MTTRRCYTCGIEKPLEDTYFYSIKVSKNKSGFRGRCILCCNKVTQAYYHNLRSEAVSLLGSKCSRCGYSEDIRILHIDHIDGGGKRHRKQRNPDQIIKDVIQSIKSGYAKYQLLCANCNWIKRYEQRETGIGMKRPHRRRSNKVLKKIG